MQSWTLKYAIVDMKNIKNRHRKLVESTGKPSQQRLCGVNIKNYSKVRVTHSNMQSWTLKYAIVDMRNVLTRHRKIVESTGEHFQRRQNVS